MKIHLHSICSSIVLGLFVDAVSGDTVTRRDGTVLEGKIIRDTVTEVEIEIGTSIKERFVIQKSDVASIGKTLPDEIAFQSLNLADLSSTPDLLEEKDYQNLLAPLQSFLQNHPESGRKEKVEQSIRALEEELEKVKEGGLKIDGNWISPEDAKRDSYNLKAKVEASKIQKALDGGKLREAFLAFEKLQKSYGDSLAYLEIIPKMIAALDSYDSRLSAGAVNSSNQIERRNSDLLRYPEAERARIEQVTAEKIEREYRAEYNELKEMRSNWPPTHLLVPESWKEAAQGLEKARKEWTSIDIERLRKKAEALANSANALADQDLKAAKLALQAAGYGSRSDELRNAIDAAMEAKSREEEEQKKKENSENSEEPIAAENTDDTAAVVPNETEIKGVAPISSPDQESTPAPNADQTSGSSTTEVDIDESEEESGDGIQIWQVAVGLALIMGLVSILLKRKGAGGKEDSTGDSN